MRQALITAFAVAICTAGCSSTTISTAPTVTVANAAAETALPTFATTDPVRLTDAERAAAVRDASARFSDSTRPLIDIPGGVVDTRTGKRYACANFYGKKSDGGNPVPVTVAGVFSGSSFAIISVGSDANNRPTWEICNRLGLNIDWRAYE